MSHQALGSVHEHELIDALGRRGSGLSLRLLGAGELFAQQLLVGGEVGTVEEARQLEERAQIGFARGSQEEHDGVPFVQSRSITLR